VEDGAAEVRPGLSRDREGPARLRPDPAADRPPPDHADRRRGLYLRPMLVGLVVERDVAADYRAVNGAGSIAEAPYRLGELPVDVGVDRGGEVEAVDDRDRDGAGAGQVRGVLEDGIPGPLVRLEVDMPGVAAAGEDQGSRTEPE